MTQPDASAPAPRNVLVTGGNRGIGLAIARAFVEGGDNVVITNRQGRGAGGPARPSSARSPTPSRSTRPSTRPSSCSADPIEVLVANAGITRDTLLMRMSDEEFDDVIATNLAGAFKCVRRASKGMIRLRRGRIILISSVVGLYGAPGQANYAASKSGLVGLARSITRELGGRGITANVVSPGLHRHRDDPGAAREGPRSPTSPPSPRAGSPSRRRSRAWCASSRAPRPHTSAAP